jgi:hypothetical protein
LCLGLGNRGSSHRLPAFHVLGVSDQIGDHRTHRHYGTDWRNRPGKITFAEYFNIHDRLVGLDRGHDRAARDFFTDCFSQVTTVPSVMVSEAWAFGA